MICDIMRMLFIVGLSSAEITMIDGDQLLFTSIGETTRESGYAHLVIPLPIPVISQTLDTLHDLRDVHQRALMSKHNIYRRTEQYGIRLIQSKINLILTLAQGQGFIAKEFQFDDKNLLQDGLDKLAAREAARAAAAAAEAAVDGNMHITDAGPREEFKRDVFDEPFGDLNDAHYTEPLDYPEEDMEEEVDDDLSEDSQYDDEDEPLEEHPRETRSLSMVGGAFLSGIASFGTSIYNLVQLNKLADGLDQAADHNRFIMEEIDVANLQIKMMMRYERAYSTF